MREPLVLIEILFPTNVSKTRANVRDYLTISTVAEIAVLRSTSIAAEVLRRGPDGAWPQQRVLKNAPRAVTRDDLRESVRGALAYW